MRFGSVKPGLSHHFKYLKLSVPSLDYLTVVP